MINEFAGAIAETYSMLVEKICEGIKHGVTEINSGTDMDLASTGKIRRYLARNPAQFDPRRYLQVATDAMYGIIKAPYESLVLVGVVKPIAWL